MKLRAELTIAADFDTQITRHIAFVQKGKTVRLTLKDTKRVLKLPAKGSLSPEVVKWPDH